MSENNNKRSLWARLVPDGNGGVKSVNLNDLVHIDFSLAADGDKLNGETSTPQDIQIITDNYLAKRASGDPSVRLLASYSPEAGEQYLFPEKDDRGPSSY